MISINQPWLRPCRMQCTAHISGSR
jgi:hypothetical protein